MKKTLLLVVSLMGLRCAQAQETVQFTAVLRGTIEVPPNQSPANGWATFELNGNTLTFGVVVQGLDPSLWSFVYGPAGPGSNAAPLFNLGISHALPVCLQCPDPFYGYGFSSEGREPTLTPDQIADLLSGRFYVSINTPAFPNGEIRGQILPVDSDHDSSPDFLDGCPDSPPGAVVDANGCSIEQLAPCEGPWRNHGEYEKAVKKTAKRFAREGLITEEEEKLIVKQAKKSDCGKAPRHHGH